MRTFKVLRPIIVKDANGGEHELMPNTYTEDHIKEIGMILDLDKAIEDGSAEESSGKDEGI